MNGKNGTRLLAVSGGKPAFEEPLHVGKPNIGERKTFDTYIDLIYRNGWLTNNGPLVRELESRLCEVLGVRNCIPVCNATAGLEILVHALGLKDEVIVPSFTFIATAHALAWCGLRPVFCDIDRETHNIDPDKIEELITDRTSAIFGVHVWGRPCEVRRLEEIARRHGLKLVFDSAHAFNCAYEGTKLGGFGNAEVFSFHATKFFNTFEGGAIATNDDALARGIRLMVNFGFNGFDSVVSIGTNAKMSEISAAMGLTNLEIVDHIIARNTFNYLAYKRFLDGVPGVSLIEYDDRHAPNYQYIVVKIDEGITGISRDAIVSALHAENVIARRYFYPGCHRMAPYVAYEIPEDALPHTEALTHSVMSLPTGTAVGTREIEKICSLIRDIIDQRKELLVAQGTRGEE